MIASFMVPAAPWTRRSLYLKVRDRESYEFALASAAVALDLQNGTCATHASRSAASQRCRGARKRPKLLCATSRSTTELANTAAEAAFAERARAAKHNEFKIELGKRTLSRALQQAAALEI